MFFKKCVDGRNNLLEVLKAKQQERKELQKKHDSLVKSIKKETENKKFKDFCIRVFNFSHYGNPDDVEDIFTDENIAMFQIFAEKGKELRSINIDKKLVQLDIEDIKSRLGIE